MIQNPNELIEEFRRVAGAEALAIVSIEHESQPAPHVPHSLPTGRSAVYVFSLGYAQGRRCKAGENRVLKVGKTGPNSNARFQSQHYSPTSSNSNLAASLLRSRILWSYLGIRELESEVVRSWITQNTDRDNFFLDPMQMADVDEANRCLSALERFIRGYLGPVFEGG